MLASVDQSRVHSCFPVSKSSQLFLREMLPLEKEGGLAQGALPLPKRAYSRPRHAWPGALQGEAPSLLSSSLGHPSHGYEGALPDSLLCQPFPR